MTVVTVFTEGKHQDMLKDNSETTKTLLYQNICINSNANIIQDLVNHKEIDQGNQSECGLLKFCKKEGQDYEKLRGLYSDCKSIAFSSDRKRMSTIIKIQGEKPFVRVLVKGQSVMILDLCVNIINGNGKVEELSAEEKDKIKSEVIEPYATKAYRTLAFAYKDMSVEEFEKV